MRDEIQYLHAKTRIDRIMRGKKTDAKLITGNKVPASVDLYQWICNTCWKIYRTKEDAVTCARTHGLSVNGLSLIEHDKCQVCSSTFRINYFDSIKSNLCYYCSYMIVGLMLDDELCVINEGMQEHNKSEVQKEC
ncbi:MAG: hypothetical protein ACRD38_10315 [Nitrososphaerales archaeon]